MAKRSWIAGRDGVAAADTAEWARIAMVDTAEQNEIAE